ncbi:MAG: type II methionyl aminopeptidase [Candidatus Micrarchaeota archaeon]|nr:type II methionyl aminopeptidase [Candidatus Micrarchaeota archaeon]
MEEDRLKQAIEVGKASQDAIVSASRLVKPGARLLDVAEAAEKALRQSGFGLAFPINLSQNERAAHYSPSLEDQTTFSERDIVKIDFGAEKNGVLGDGALTIDLSGEHGKMVEAAEKALDNAISMVKAGIEVRKIGAEIARTVESAGFKVILNLGGHGIEENDLHTGSFIPNYDNGDSDVLEDGAIIAIEPFITTKSGKGQVTEGDNMEIYSYVGGAVPRTPGARKVLHEIESKYPKNPFAVRWLGSGMSRFSLYSAISELSKTGCISVNPVLIEMGRAPVAQAEAELLVEKDSCKVITLAKRTG